MTFENIFGDKFSKFRLGQLIFITAVTFGLFAGDVIRIVLGVLSLFFLTRENFKFPKWTRAQKITLTLLALFCAWMIIIPVIFGENPLNVRLRDAVRPLELTIWICVTFLFAKDEFFVRNLKNFSITACFCYAVIALVWCLRTKFALLNTADDWPFIKSSYSLGALMAGLSAWVIYQYLTVKNLLAKFFCFATLLCAMALVILSNVVTYWAAFCAEIVIIFLMLLFIDRKKFLILIASFLIVSAVTVFGIYNAMQHDDSLKSIVSIQIEQITVHKDSKFDAEKFTNKRYHIWKDAIAAIKQKPLLGHGREIFAQYCSTGHVHAHNACLQMSFEAGIPLAIIAYSLWFTIFLLAAYKLFAVKKLLILPFATIAIMAEFVTAGLVENMFLTNRAQLVLFWPVFITMIAMYNKVRDSK